MDPESEALVRELQRIVNLSRRVQGKPLDTGTIVDISIAAQHCIRQVRALHDTTVHDIRAFRR